MSDFVIPSVSKRLPPNPRQKVADEMRKRTKRACNSCNSKRIKCRNSLHPCVECAKHNRLCEYDPQVKKINIPEQEVEDLRASNALFERCLQDVLPDPIARQALLARKNTEAAALMAADLGSEHASPAASSSTLTTSMDDEQYHRFPRSSSLPTEGAQLRDDLGNERWLGGTSGATFLDHLKKFMHTLKESLGYCDTPTGSTPGSSFLTSRGCYQTSDSRPLTSLHTANVNSPSQLTRDTVSKLLSKVDYFVQDGKGTYPSGGIYFLDDCSMQIWDGARSNPKQMRGELAFFVAAFAYGSLFSLTTANSRKEGKLGETFYMRARNMLNGFTLDSVYSIRDIPAFALLAMYMSEMNRRDTAYTLVEFALDICNKQGLLRNTAGDERSKRQFWTLYCMNRDLSCMMGRPPLISDEAIHVDLPIPTPGLPPPDGLQAHIELAKIAGYVVSNTYGIAPQEQASRYQTPSAQVEEPLQMLRTWHQNLPPSLQITDWQNLPADRPLCTLHMKYHQLIILTLRPIFFLAVKSTIGGDLTHSQRYIDNHDDIQHIRDCSEAARYNSVLGRHIYDNLSPDRKLIMPDLHHIFNAAVILLLKRMVFLNIETTVSQGIDFARKIFEKEAEYGDIYGRDCFGVLNDLTALVWRLRPVILSYSDHAGTGEADLDPDDFITPEKLAENLAKKSGLSDFGDGMTNWKAMETWCIDPDPPWNL